MKSILFLSFGIYATLTELQKIQISYYFEANRNIFSMKDNLEKIEAQTEIKFDQLNLTGIIDIAPPPQDLANYDFMTKWNWKENSEEIKKEIQRIVLEAKEKCKMGERVGIEVGKFVETEFNPACSLADAIRNANSFLACFPEEKEFYLISAHDASLLGSLFDRNAHPLPVISDINKLGLKDKQIKVVKYMIKVEIKKNMARLLEKVTPEELVEKFFNPLPNGKNICEMPKMHYLHAERFGDLRDFEPMNFGGHLGSNEFLAKLRLFNLIKETYNPDKYDELCKQLVSKKEAELMPKYKAAKKAMEELGFNAQYKYRDVEDKLNEVNRSYEGSLSLEGYHYHKGKLPPYKDPRPSMPGVSVGRVREIFQGYDPKAFELVANDILKELCELVPAEPGEEVISTQPSYNGNSRVRWGAYIMFPVIIILMLFIVLALQQNKAIQKENEIIQKE